MIIRRFLLVTCFACILPFNAFSEAPVVDDSENFALLDEQQVALEQPVAKSQSGDYGSDEETAFASDNLETSSNSNSKNAMLLDKVQGLQQEVQELRGQLEVQAHDLKLLQQQQLAFYKDLDARLPNQAASSAKNVAANPLPVGVTTPKSPSAIPSDKQSKPEAVVTPAPHAARMNPADEQISYLAAYELVKNKRFDEALEAMQKFVTLYPQGGYTGNAQYWLGELYMVKKGYPEAIEHFEIVLHQFPSSNKSAASMLKIGYALAASGKKAEAVQRLQQVMKNYPDTNTAQLAKAKLDALNS
jgi:tol-pal system protein YbgF